MYFGGLREIFRKSLWENKKKFYRSEAGRILRFVVVLLFNPLRRVPTAKPDGNFFVDIDVDVVGLMLGVGVIIFFLFFESLIKSTNSNLFFLFCLFESSID